MDSDLQVTLPQVVVGLVALHAPVGALVRRASRAAPADAHAADDPRGRRVLREERVAQELGEELREFFLRCLETEERGVKLA